MVSEGGKHLGQLKDDVASPNGTTISGFHELGKGGFRGILLIAVVAAARRSQEFSRRWFMILLPLLIVLVNNLK